MLALGALERDVLYTISVDGGLFEISAGKNSVRAKLIAQLGPPFEKDDTQVEGLAMSPTDGMLYAAVSSFDGKQCTSHLYRLDPAGKSVQCLGQLAATEIDGLAFDKDGVLYGMASSGKAAKKAAIGQLVRIDHETAKTQNVSADLGFCDVDALSISDEGVALVSNGHSVIRSNLGEEFRPCPQISGHPLHELTCQLGDIEGIAFQGKSTAYGLCRRCANSHLIRFDLKTEECQYMGNLGVGALNLTGRVSVVEEAGNDPND